MYRSIFYIKSLIIIGSIILIVGCNNKFTPKPRGYFRIDFPDRGYQLLDSTLPYSFEYPTYGKIVPHETWNAEPYWINVAFPQFNAQIHISYKNVSDNLYDLYEDNIRLAYNHVVKADAIEEHIFFNDEHNLYGMLFEIKGNAASPMQFFATDSIRHFLRGSLYFNTQPNKDSLSPIINFLTDDVMNLVETIRWKN